MLEVDVRGRAGTFELDVRFASDAGVTALFGHSGAGKTSVVNMIAGLMRPSAGRIRVGDRVLFDAAAGIELPARRRHLGLVFQEGRLFPHLTVRQNLLYGSWFTRPRVPPDQFDEVVQLLGIDHLLARRPRALSGGERQRVAVGRALLCRPEALLMDEPLASLDGARKNEILPYLDRLRAEARIPIVYVSHSIDEVTRLAETLVVLSEGRVVGFGPVDEIMARLDLRPMTGRFEAGSVVDGVVEGHDADYELTAVAIGSQELVLPKIDAAPGSPVRLRIRARDVALALRAPEDLSIRNVLCGSITEVRAESGTFVEVNVDVEGLAISSRITRRSAEMLGLAPGREIFALIKSVAIDRPVGSRPRHH